MASLQFLDLTTWQPKSVQVIEGKSNGFLGNNHTVYAQKDTESNYTYSYQDNPSSGLLANIIDSNPLTYFEYEKISIDREEILSRGAKDYEFTYSYQDFSNNAKSIKYKSWINYEEKDPLKLVLSIRSDRPQKANTISIVPFWGTDQTPGAQIKVTRVVAVDQQSKEVDLIDEPIYVGNVEIPMNLESSKNYVYDKIKISFLEILTSEIQVYIEQCDFLNVNIKHLFWKPLPSTGRLSALNNQTRFDPSSLSSLGFSEVQYNQFDLVPDIIRPNFYKDQFNLSTKQINITYKDQEKIDSYILSFQRLSDSSLVKHYYTNAFTGFETLSKQQEKAASTDIKFAWQSESKEAADRIKLYIESKISSGEWSSSQFQNLNIEIVKRAFDPKTYTATITLKKEYEIYKAKRHAIGLRSIDIGYATYASSGSFISKTFEFSYDVKNLTISIDSRTGRNSLNEQESLLKFYVSLDEAKNWIRISPIENPSTGVPEVLSFNEFVQTGEKIKGVGYYNYPAIPSETKRIKVKIEMFRSKYFNSTPLLFSYKLIGRVEQT
jgi:hypothetical protein